MDAHLYFAYGSNMHAQQMRGRCADATPVEKAVLLGWQVRIGVEGVATIVEAPSEQSWGVLWSVSDADILALDRYEGVASGYYRRVVLTVEGPDGLVQAFVYIQEWTGDGPGRPGYLDTILLGARHFDLPESHVDHLASLGRREGIG